MEVNEQEWHEWRRQGIGGSDIAAIVGLSNFGSAWSVWAEKVGLTQPRSTDTQRQRIGKRMESVLAAEFADATGLYVAGEQTWCASPKQPHRRCTVDGFVVEAPSAAFGEVDMMAAVGGWEAKTDGRFSWPDGVPPNIRAQCVWNMGVTGMEHWWLTVMFAGFRVEVFELTWDSDAIDDWKFMSRAADEFWTNHVLTGTAPEADGSDATRHAIAEVYPDQAPGERVDVDGNDVEVRGNLRAAIKEATDELAIVENRLRVQIGDAEFGCVGGVPALSLRTQTRKTTCAHCGHVEESEPFRVLRPASKRDKEQAA